MVVVIAVLCFAGIAVGRLPVLRMNRATIALVGAVLVVAAGGMSLRDALSSLDLSTLALLFGVMILSVNLSYCGFFRLVAYRITRHARSRRQLLALLIAASGLLSSVFLNDTICLMVTPLVLEITRSRKLSPVPYLIALAASANIGSAATEIGNPQNILIGAVSGIDFLGFIAHLVIPALLGLAVVWTVIVTLYRREFRPGPLPAAERASPRVYRPLLVKSLGGVVIMLAAIAVGLSTSLAALLAASFLLVTRRIKPDRVLRDVDWTLLVFFASLFILTAVIGSTGAYRSVVEARLLTVSAPLFAGCAALLSNLISNVPAVMLLRPVVEGHTDPHLWWLLLSLSTTLAGNLTLLGSVANLIVAEGARKRGIALTFGTYLRAGVPITLITLAIGVGWLLLTASVGHPG